jgi:hypothetical protein
LYAVKNNYYLNFIIDINFEIFIIIMSFYEFLNPFQWGSNYRGIHMYLVDENEINFDSNRNGEFD